MNDIAPKTLPILRRRSNRKDYSHPSVIALIREAGMSADPEEIVRTKCRDIVRSAKADGWSGPPFDPELLASLLGIQVKKVYHDIGAEARIYGMGGQAYIEYRPDIAIAERLRFSICHEIAHTVFPDCFRIPRHLHLEGEEQSPATREFERLCDIGAGELLMPLEEFNRDLNTTTVTLGDICKLKRLYLASAEAAVNRCLGLTHLPRAAVFLHILQSQLVVKFYWKSNSFKAFIPPGASPPPSSIVHTVPLAGELETDLLPTRQEAWTRDGGLMHFHVQAIPLPLVPQNPDYPKILALVAPV